MSSSKITSSSTAEYFSKNLQQVGFSSGTKAVLTTLKESVDNSLDACEDAEILPEILVEIERVGSGTQKNMDQIRVLVSDNGPGIPADSLSMVYGEYLASSKFGRGRCSRGQQGIGISAATTWAQLTSAKGVTVISKTKKMPQAIRAVIEVDIKKNQGLLRDKKSITWDRPHGTSVEFLFDGRMQMQGEGGILTYLRGTSLVNPHLKLTYKINNDEPVVFERVTDESVDIPGPVSPHPHTMKLGEFINHMHLFGKATLQTFLEKGFSRITTQVTNDMAKYGFKKPWLKKSLSELKKEEHQIVYQSLQKVELMAPSTRSVLRIGEESLSKSVNRLGEIDFFSVVSRKPKICDAKPVVVEVAVARLKDSKLGEDDTAQVLRFANRVPLQFDKAACAIVKAIESVNWKAYGLQQSKNSIPQGPYVIAVSVVSPFIKFKNASKETIDASEELVEELRLAIMQAGQKLSRHIKKELKAADYEKKIQHIEQFGPILIEGLGRITKASEKQLAKAREGLVKILGRDTDVALEDLKKAEEAHQKLGGKGTVPDPEEEIEAPPHPENQEPVDERTPVKKKSKKQNNKKKK
ncbi:MAG: DNA topoisomerase VI subunit B [Bdellovibrionota bacterium]